MNKPIWTSIKKRTRFPQLTQKVKADVAVAGGGLAGVFCAYLLAKEGKKVVLVEKDWIGNGETAYTTAFITYVVDKNLSNLAEKVGEKNAKLVWEAGKTAIMEIEKIISREKIKCDFLQCKAYVYALNKNDVNILKKEAELGQKFGFDISFKNDGKLCFDNFGYLEIREQAKFHPLKFLHQLTMKAKEAGILIFENTEVLDIEKGDPVKIKTEHGLIEAEFAIVDTHNPIDPRIMPGKLISFQSYVTSYLINKGILEEAIYWDTEKPYSYFRLDPCEKFDRLILGGRDHLTSKEPNPGKHFEELEEYFKKNFKYVDYKIEATWSGRVLESADGMAYIGRSLLDPSILLSTGFSGNGMTYSCISAMLIRDLIMGKTNKYIELFDPGRIGIEENAKICPFTQEPEISKEKISPNSGKVIEINGEKVAIYKGGDDKTHKLSPVCTHLGCAVGWNDKEKTWDCPCHGSRYSKDGSVLNGPAKNPLRKLK